MSIEKTSHSTVFLGLAVTTLCVTVLGIGWTTGAAADERDKKTIVTFSAPVEIPGKALPAGTYVFKVLDSASNRNILQIFDKDEKQLYATILAIPDYRLRPSDKPVIRFEERPSGTPEAIKAFFYPGDDYGLQFVYPHDRAVQIARPLLMLFGQLRAQASGQQRYAAEQKYDAEPSTPHGGHLRGRVRLTFYSC